jgi:hypothetical protein
MLSLVHFTNTETASRPLRVRKKRLIPISTKLLLNGKFVCVTVKLTVWPLAGKVKLIVFCMIFSLLKLYYTTKKQNGQPITLQALGSLIDRLANREYNKACSNLEGVDVEAGRLFLVLDKAKPSGYLGESQGAWLGFKMVPAVHTRAGGSY